MTCKEVIKTQNSFYIVFEFCSGGDLAGYIKKNGKLPNKKVQKFMQDISVGLKYLQDYNIIHRDLKPGNFLLSDTSEYPTIKIADFGLAKTINDNEREMLQTMCGTPMYMAPEILKGF